MDTPESRVTVSKGQFRFVMIALTIAFTSAELTLWKTACLKLNWSSPNFIIFIYPLGAANWLFSWYVADRFYKGAGLSLSGKNTEVWERTPSDRECTPDDCEAVELVLVRSEVRINFVMGLLLCILMMLGGYFFRTEWMLAILAPVGGVFLGSLAIQQWFAWDGCVLRADSKGVLGLPRRFALRRHWLPWSEIASCEITTHYDTFGAPCLVVPVFKDDFGRTLMRMSLFGGLASMTIEHQQRLAKYIKVRCSNKAKFDLAEV
jgi:hypothetical protein